jgi:hypothetical protein
MKKTMKKTMKRTMKKTGGADVPGYAKDTISSTLKKTEQTAKPYNKLVTQKNTKNSPSYNIINNMNNDSNNDNNNDKYAYLKFIKLDRLYSIINKKIEQVTELLNENYDLVTETYPQLSTNLTTEIDNHLNNLVEYGKKFNLNISLSGDNIVDKKKDLVQLFEKIKEKIKEHQIEEAQKENFIEFHKEIDKHLIPLQNFRNMLSDLITDK